MFVLTLLLFSLVSSSASASEMPSAPKQVTVAKPKPLRHRPPLSTIEPDIHLVRHHYGRRATIGAVLMPVGVGASALGLYFWGLGAPQLGAPLTIGGLGLAVGGYIVSTSALTRAMWDLSHRGAALPTASLTVAHVMFASGVAAGAVGITMMAIDGPSTAGTLLTLSSPFLIASTAIPLVAQAANTNAAYHSLPTLRVHPTTVVTDSGVQPALGLSGSF